MRFCCVLCLLLLLSACAAPVADQVALKSGSSIDRSEVSNILGDQDFYVFFDIEGGEIAIDSVQESEMSGKQNDIYAYNRKTLQASNVDLKKAKLKECVKISGVGQYATCYSGTPPKGSLFSETSLDGGEVFGSVLTATLMSPFIVLNAILDPGTVSDNVSGITDGTTVDSVNKAQVDRIGAHVCELLASEIKSAAIKSDSVFSLLKKYPDAGLENNSFLAGKISKFAADDYRGIDRNKSQEIEGFIQTYSQFGLKSYLTPTIPKLNVRQGPGVKNKVAFTIGKNNKIYKVLERRNGWVKFSGNEINRSYPSRYSYWVSEKYLEKKYETPSSEESKQLTNVLAQAKGDLATLHQKAKQRRVAAERKRQQELAAEAERKRIAEEKRQAELKQQKLAQIQPQLQEAITENSMPKLEAFISKYKEDPDTEEMVAKANAKYKELLFQ